MDWDLLILVGGVVAVTAVRGHYRTQKTSVGGGARVGNPAGLEAATDLARRLETRIEVLENILDEDVPGWRARTRS